MEIANKAYENAKDDEQHAELFTEYLLKELREVKGTDISRCLSCELDLIKQQYVITLKLPITSNIFDSVGSESK